MPLPLVHASAPTSVWRRYPKYPFVTLQSAATELCSVILIRGGLRANLPWLARSPVFIRVVPALPPHFGVMISTVTVVLPEDLPRVSTAELQRARLRDLGFRVSLLTSSAFASKSSSPPAFMRGVPRDTRAFASSYVAPAATL